MTRQRLRKVIYSVADAGPLNVCLLHIYYLRGSTSGSNPGDAEPRGGFAGKTFPGGDFFFCITRHFRNSRFALSRLREEVPRTKDGRSVVSREDVKAPAKKKKKELRLGVMGLFSRHFTKSETHFSCPNQKISVTRPIWENSENFTYPRCNTQENTTRIVLFQPRVMSCPRFALFQNVFLFLKKKKIF